MVCTSGSAATASWSITRSPAGRARRAAPARASICDRQRQIGIHRWGGYAEYVSVPAQNVHPVPEGLTFPEATVVVRHAPLAFALARRAELRAGEWALVMGAAGRLAGVCGRSAERRVGDEC